MPRITAPAPTTDEWLARRGSSHRPERDPLDPAHGSAVARSAGAVWLLEERLEPISPPIWLDGDLSDFITANHTACLNLANVLDAIRWIRATPDDFRCGRFTRLTMIPVPHRCPSRDHSSFANDSATPSHIRSNVLYVHCSVVGILAWPRDSAHIRTRIDKEGTR